MLHPLLSRVQQLCGTDQTFQGRKGDLNASKIALVVAVLEEQTLVFCQENLQSPKLFYLPFGLGKKCVDARRSRALRRVV